MAELFNVTFDLGPDAPVPVVTTAVGDIGVVADTAMDLAQAVAEQEARRYLSELVANEGLRALVSQVRRRELRVAETFERDIAYLERAAEEFDLMAGELGVPRPWPPRYHKAALLWGLLMPGLPSPAPGGAPWHPIVERLVVAEKLDRLPTESCRVRSLSYANPAEVALIMASGAASAALGYLLTVIAALGPRRRREAARAAAEERIQSAHARDVEDLVERRIELRRLLLDRIIQGTIELQPEDVTDALLDKIIGAADRLGERQLSFERLELPTGK